MLVPKPFRHPGILFSISRLQDFERKASFKLCLYFSFRNYFANSKLQQFLPTSLTLRKAYFASHSDFNFKQFSNVTFLPISTLKFSVTLRKPSAIAFYVTWRKPSRQPTMFQNLILCQSEFVVRFVFRFQFQQFFKRKILLPPSLGNPLNLIFAVSIQSARFQTVRSDSIHSIDSI